MKRKLSSQALKKLHLHTPLPDEQRKPFWYSFGLHLLLLIGIIIAAKYHREIFFFGSAVRSPQQVQIVNATLVLPEPSLSKVITPTPPASAAQPQPTPTPPQPVSKPTPKPTPVTPKPKPTPTKSAPVQVAKTGQIQQKAPPKATPKQPSQAQLQKQQALQKLKALGLSSINQVIDTHNTQQQEAASAAQAAQILSMEEQYMGLIQQTIRSNWINQFDPNAQLTAVLKIRLDPTGKVLSVSVASSSGNPAFDRQAVLAVQKSSPLPMPPDPDLVKKFMNLTLPFNNQDLQ